MSCLNANFTLTPKTPSYVDPSTYAVLECFGADFLSVDPENLASLASSNRFFFDSAFASDPTVDYSQFANRQKARFVETFILMPGFAGSSKQFALIFGFDVSVPARVQVYSDAQQLADETLALGDTQFLIVIEPTSLPSSLYFIHAGGQWFFRGISCYVV